MAKTTRTFEIETRHSAQGTLPAEDSPEAASYRARVVEGDGRKAEALVDVLPDLDVLQKIRTYLRIGSLDKVRAVIDSITEHTPELLAEIFLEESRLAVFEGRWSDALELTDLSLKSEPRGLTQMTLRQVRAVVLFELGQFKQALAEIETAGSFARLFPNSGLGFYVAATHVKILARAGRVDEAETKLDRAWRALIASPDLNPDNVLVLLRGDHDLSRLQNKPSAELAFACWTLARWSGDAVYAALSATDLHATLSPALRDAWDSQLQVASSYARIRRLREDAASENAVTASARALRDTAAETAFARRPSDFENIYSIALLHRGLRIEARDLRVHSLELSKQVLAALGALAHEAPDKESFFRTVWGKQKFNPDLHDSVIRSLLHRLRKSHDLKIETAEGKVSAPGLLIVKR